MNISDLFGDGMPDGIGYESPITLFIGAFETKMENDAVQAVQQYGFDVDKEELFKALKYDRDQYKVGYSRGREDGMLLKPKGQWKGDFCSECGISKYNFFTVIQGVNGDHSRPFGTWGFCPNCGADMRGADDE